MRAPLRSVALRCIQLQTLRPNRTMATNGALNGSMGADAESTAKRPSLRYIDIGINLTDDMYTGSYHGKKAHDNDLDHVIERAQNAGVAKMLVTGSSLEESKKTVQLAEQYPGLCYATVGVHPCSAKSFEQFATGPDALLQELRALAVKARDDGTVCAFGEIGLDYDRLHFCDKDTQKKYFKKQLDIAVEVQLPLFLHSRAAAEDFEAILSERLSDLPKRGVVHSFTGSLDEMQRLVDLGFDIGINGCSMKTEENIQVVKAVPVERLQLETDGPWCDMRATHASAQYLKDAPPMVKSVKKEKWSIETMVKGRNEPCTMVQVAHAVAAIKDLSVEELCSIAWRNSIRMFGFGESGKQQG